MDLLRDDHGLTGAGHSRAAAPPRCSTSTRASVNTGRPARDVITADFPWCEPHCRPSSTCCGPTSRASGAQALLDFDDLLLGWRALLAQPS